MNPHPFHAFTTRDGSVACSQCNAPLSDPVHLPELPGYVAEMVAEITRLRDEVDRVKTREMLFIRSNGELTKEVLDLRSERDRAWGCNNSLTTQVAMISGMNEQLRTERDAANRRANENEQQLCEIAMILGGDARQAPDREPTIAGLVRSHIAKLEAAIERALPYVQEAMAVIAARVGSHCCGPESNCDHDCSIRANTSNDLFFIRQALDAAKEAK